MNRNKPNQTQVEISSLIDIIFILLIFFVVTTTFQKSSLDINLPKSTIKSTQQRHGSTNIYINKSGQCYINNTAYSHTMIRTYLKNNKTTSIVIYPDKDTITQHLVALMQTLIKENITSISIATDKK